MGWFWVGVISVTFSSLNYVNVISAMEAMKLEFDLLVHFGFHFKIPRSNAEMSVCVVVEHLLVGCLDVPLWYKLSFFSFFFFLSLFFLGGWGGGVLLNISSLTIAELRAGLSFQSLLWAV
jgi:hypothetical protein